VQRIGFGLSFTRFVYCASFNVPNSTTLCTVSLEAIEYTLKAKTK
jgi:hypothetical protein